MLTLGLIYYLLSSFCSSFAFIFSSLLRLLPTNFYMYSNLGGWTVQMSQLHQSWQEGRKYIPPEMVEKFNQLNAMGFGFDVFLTRRGEQSWEDSFGLLLQYRQETGSCRVSHHYKADFQ
mmetsp:Transcript_23614/g.42435  ORF Transcript_23614/g.42435 Transcript_23614/m.42435 type:complete len:119 (+) Transcript_23614:196-552(+)